MIFIVFIFILSFFSNELSYLDKENYEYLYNLPDTNYEQIKYKTDIITNNYLRSIDNDHYLLGLIFISYMYSNAKLAEEDKYKVIYAINNKVNYLIDDYLNPNKDLFVASMLTYSLIGGDYVVDALFNIVLKNLQNIYDPKKFDEYLTIKECNNYDLNQTIIPNKNSDYIKFQIPKAQIDLNENLLFDITENLEVQFKEKNINYGKIKVENENDKNQYNPYYVFLYKSKIHIIHSLNTLGNILTKKSANALYKLAKKFHGLNNEFFNLALSYLLANYRNAFENIRDLESEGYIPMYVYQNVIDNRLRDLENEEIIPMLAFDALLGAVGMGIFSYFSFEISQMLRQAGLKLYRMLSPKYINKNLAMNLLRPKKALYQVGDTYEIIKLSKIRRNTATIHLNNGSYKPKVPLREINPDLSKLSHQIRNGDVVILKNSDGTFSEIKVLNSCDGKIAPCNKGAGNKLIDIPEEGVYYKGTFENSPDLKTIPCGARTTYGRGAN